MKKTPLLGGLTPGRFFREYWHKKPLLIRQAFPDFKPLLPRETLFALAGQPEVETRLITHFRQQWQMENGPIARLPDVKKKEWTLLVQGVNLHDDAADALLRQFRFIPDARLDDLMISYATDAGGVGPHFDSYDVFLLQAQGQRRWRIGAQKDLSLVEGLPLKILRNFMPEQEFVLDPGDMLYLPPHYAHDGIAIGECMTYSIGFRAPSYQELGESFLAFMADSIELPGRYADPDLEAVNHPARIGRRMVSRIAEQFNKVKFDNTDITIFLGEYLSEPKSSVFFDGPSNPLNLSRFSRAVMKCGVKLSRKTQMLYQGKYLFINGISLVADGSDKSVLTALADRRALDGIELHGLSADAMKALHAWYLDGWILL